MMKRTSDISPTNATLPSSESAADNSAPTRSAYLRWIKTAVGGAISLIPVDEVQYFRADSKYTVLFTAHSEALIRTPLRELRAELDPSIFWQIHRSFIVNAYGIRTVHRSYKGSMDLRLKHRSETLPVSAAHAHMFKAS